MPRRRRIPCYEGNREQNPENSEKVDCVCNPLSVMPRSIVPVCKLGIERDAPEACQTNQGINDSAHNGCLAAEDRGDDIKLENSDEQPVYCADNNEC